MSATFQFRDIENKGNTEVVVMLDKLFLLEIEELPSGDASVLLTGNGGMGKFKLTAESLAQLKQAVGCNSASTGK